MPLAASRNHPIDCGDFDAAEPQRAFPKETIANKRFRLTANPQARATGAQTDAGQVTVSSFGAIVSRKLSESYEEDVIVSVEPTGSREFGQMSISSQTPSVLSGSATFAPNASGQVVLSYQGDGTAVISALSGVGAEQRAVVPVAAGGSQNIDSWVDYADSSLGKHLESQVASASGSMDIFSSMSHASEEYSRNPSFWLSGVDITCFSPWNSRGGQQRAGTLISPQFAMCAQHFELLTGDTIRFVAADGSVVNRTIVDYRLQFGAFDAQIVKLSEPIGEEITPCKVMPAGYVASSGYLNGAYKWLPTSSLSSLNQGLLGQEIALSNDVRPFPPALMCNQDKKCGIAATTSLGLGWTGGTLSPSQYEGKAGRIFYPALDVQSLVRGGCSGSPVFFLIAGELCLLGVLFYDNSVGSCFTDQLTHNSVQAVMDEMGSDGSDQLTSIDLSSFTDFSA